jgi:hypothetical protein
MNATTYPVPPWLWLTVLGIVCAAFLCLGGCASRPPSTIRTQLVDIAIHAPCTPADVPKAPAGYADDVVPKGAAGIVTRYRLGAEANAQRKARLAIVEPVVEACR